MVTYAFAPRSYRDTRFREGIEELFERAERWQLSERLRKHRGEYLKKRKLLNS